MIQRYSVTFFLLLTVSGISCQRLTDPLQNNITDSSNSKPTDLPFYLQDSSWFSLAVMWIDEDSNSTNLCY